MYNLNDRNQFIFNDLLLEKKKLKYLKDLAICVHRQNKSFWASTFYLENTVQI